MKKIILLLPVIMLLLVSSCKKDETEELTFLVWWDELTAENLALDGVTALKIYVDGALIGQESTIFYYNSSIDCDANDAITKTYTVDKGENEFIVYTIRNQNDIIIDSGTYDVSATCNLLEFVY